MTAFIAKVLDTADVWANSADDPTLAALAEGLAVVCDAETLR